MGRSLAHGLGRKLTEPITHPHDAAYDDEELRELGYQLACTHVDADGLCPADQALCVVPEYEEPEWEVRARPHRHPRRAPPPI